VFVDHIFCRLIEEQEKQPDFWFRERCSNMWRENKLAVSEFLGSSPDNLVFVHNTTTGCTRISATADGPSDAKCRNVVNCCTNITNSQQILSRPNGVTVGRRVVNSHGASTVVVVNHVDRRRVLLTTRSTCGDEIL